MGAKQLKLRWYISFTSYTDGFSKPVKKLQ